MIGITRSVVAEHMTAMTALEIAEDFFVDDIADFRAGHGAGGPTEQTAEDGTGQTAEQYAGRTTDCANGCTGLRAGERATGTGGGTTDCADRAANPSGSVKAINVAGIADGT
jgi:hypothetical protein